MRDPVAAVYLRGGVVCVCVWGGGGVGGGQTKFPIFSRDSWVYKINS